MSYLYYTVKNSNRRRPEYCLTYLLLYCYCCTVAAIGRDRFVVIKWLQSHRRESTELKKETTIIYKHTRACVPTTLDFHRIILDCGTIIMFNGPKSLLLCYHDCYCVGLVILSIFFIFAYIYILKKKKKHYVGSWLYINRFSCRNNNLCVNSALCVFSDEPVVDYFTPRRGEGEIVS